MGSAPPSTCGRRSTLLHDAGDLRVALGIGQAPVADGEGDLAGVPGLLREALLQQVEGALGLGPRQREVVDEPAAGSGGEGERRDDGDDPGGHDDAAAVIGKGGKAAHADDLAHTQRNIAIHANMLSMQRMLRSSRHGSQGAQEGADAPGDRGRRVPPVRRARVPGDDRRRHRRRRRSCAAHVLRLLPLQGGRAVRGLRRDLRGPCRADCAAARRASRRSTRCATWITGLLPDLEADEDREAIRHRLCSEYESIAAHERHLMARFEAIIAESVAADLGDTPSDLRPRMIAAAAIAALMAMRARRPRRRRAAGRTRSSSASTRRSSSCAAVSPCWQPGPVPQR